MQVKTQLKYYLLSFIVLFTVSGTVLGNTHVAETAITAKADNLPADTKYNDLLSDKNAAPGQGSSIGYTGIVSDLAISITHVLQAGSGFSGKKIQHDNDILLLISARHSAAVKVFNGNHIIIADQLRHVFLFLFPYHFFW